MQRYSNGWPESDAHGYVFSFPSACQSRDLRRGTRLMVARAREETNRAPISCAAVDGSRDPIHIGSSPYRSEHGHAGLLFTRRIDTCGAIRYSMRERRSTRGAYGDSIRNRRGHVYFGVTWILGTRFARSADGRTLRVSRAAGRLALRRQVLNLRHRRQTTRPVTNVRHRIASRRTIRIEQWFAE